MATCPQCNARIAWDAVACSECHGIFDDLAGWIPVGENADEKAKLEKLRPIPNPELAAEIEAAQPPSDLSALDTFLLIGFGILALFWPFVAIATPLMFDNPGSGGFPAYLLSFAILAYGPVYVFTLIKTRLLMKRIQHRKAIQAWLWLCGGNVFLGVFAVILIQVFCKGTFVCSWS